MRYISFFRSLLNYLIIKKIPLLFVYSLSLSLLLNPLLFAQSGIITGKASYYANTFQGKKTASGEKYDQHKYTAAHRTLPFGTQLKVTNLTNGKTVVVVVNDRGPYSKDRLIDLSLIAAKTIDMVQCGIAQVQIEEVSSTQPNEEKNQPENSLALGFYSKDLHAIQRPKGYLLQIGSFSTSENAKERIDELEHIKIGHSCIEKVKIKKQLHYRVLYSGFSSKSDATAEQKKLKKKGIDSIVLSPK